MGLTVGIIGAVTAAYGAYSAHDNARKQQGAQENAQNAAAKTADAADQANNQANQKTPDENALLSANQAAGKNGPSGTMLTGPGGVDPSLLQLGKSTLLGA